MRFTRLLVGMIGLCAALLATPAAAIEYRLPVSADTTVFSDNQGTTQWHGWSDGGPNLWLSTTMGGLVRRALVRFDVSAIPAGSQITSVQLVLYQTRARGNQVVTVHRLLNSWGEATSDAGDAGTGVPAQPGDATWSHRFYPTVPWSQLGGEHAPQASTSVFVGSASDPHTWPSTPQMVADVQGWLASPATNHGWILIGDELTDGSAKRLGSRQNTLDLVHPVLVVQANPPPPEPVPEGDVPLPLWATLCLGGGLLALIRRRKA